jgi:hypothetical protein
MRCFDARTAIELIADVNNETPSDPILRDHLNSCKSCAEYFSQFRRAWQALDAYSSVEPSPDFILKAKSRIQRQASGAGPGFFWHAVAGWQWMTVSACILILCTFVFLSQHASPPAPKIDAAQIDTSDDKLIQEIDQSLSQLEENESLADYDSWSGTYFEAATPELPRAPEPLPPQEKGRDTL